MVRLSGSSVTSPPSALISLVIAARRSVSCNLVCPTPVKVDGPEPSAATEVSGRQSSGTSRRSATIGLMTPDPVTVSPAGPDETAPPIRVSTSRIASAGCSEFDGQSLTVTEPPVTSAAARNGPALDRSGSTLKSPRSSRPGRTRQKSGRSPAPTSTSAPASEIIRTVISMCGSDGTGGPTWCTSMPRSNRAAASSSPETSCDEAEASSVTGPPRTAPDPWIVNGSAPRPPSSIDTPSSRRAASKAPIGRSRARGSPSNATEAGDSAVSAGRNRMVVPELPTSTLTDEPGSMEPPETARSVPYSSREQPRIRSAAIARDVSRAFRTPLSTAGESLSAASISARLEIDLEPGSRKVARTGPCAAGARQRPDSITLRVSVDAEGVAHVRSVRLRSQTSRVARGVRRPAGRRPGRAGGRLRRLQRGADQADLRGDGPQGGARAPAAPLGPGAVLGQGRQGRLPDDQRPGRDGGGQARLPRRLLQAPLPDPGRRLLRMADGAGLEGQAAVLHLPDGRRHPRLRRPVRAVEEPRGAGGSRGRLVLVGHDHHDRRDRRDRQDPRPDADGGGAGRLGGLARPGQR